MKIPTRQLTTVDADAKARQILREHADELYREAERVAERSGTDWVAPRYVEQAAYTVRVRRTASGAADVLMSVGTALFGLGGGALIAMAATDDSDQTGVWIALLSVRMLVVGSAMTATGATAKWISR